MTFGAADMMNMPWETVVKIYAQKLGSRRFDTLGPRSAPAIAL
jgi:hypothetical protein